MVPSGAADPSCGDAARGAPVRSGGVARVGAPAAFLVDAAAMDRDGGRCRGCAGEEGRGAMGFLTRWIVVGLGLWLASELVPGIEVQGGWTLAGAAILLGVVNAVVRPVLVVLTLPFTLLTLGLFLLVINAAMLGLVAAVFRGFVIEGFWSAVLGSIVISLTGWLSSWFIGPRGRVEVLVQRKP